MTSIKPIYTAVAEIAFEYFFKNLLCFFEMRFSSLTLRGRSSQAKSRDIVTGYSAFKTFPICLEKSVLYIMINAAAPANIHSLFLIYGFIFLLRKNGRPRKRPPVWYIFISLNFDNTVVSVFSFIYDIILLSFGIFKHKE